MRAFFLRRLLMTVFVLFIVSLLSFMLLQLIPGDPVVTMLGVEASQEQITALQHELWLDKPVVVQYGHWMGNALRGNFGKSVIFREDVAGLIAKRLPITLHLTSLALFLSSVVGVFAGTICASRRSSILDQTVSVLANTGLAIPTFWLGILGIYLFGLKLVWLPIQGYTSPVEDFVLSTKQIVMPVICMAFTHLAIMARQTRSSMLEVIHQDYIRTAWAKGLNEQKVIIRHALKNALIPIVTLLGVSLPNLVGGSVIVETIFNIPGMGRLLVSSIFAKDFIVVQACVLLVAIVVSLANLLIDICYGWLDPKIRYQ